MNASRETSLGNSIRSVFSAYKVNSYPCVPDGGKGPAYGFTSRYPSGMAAPAAPVVSDVTSASMSTTSQFT